MVGGGYYCVAPCIRVCSVFQLLLGCVALAAGPLGNSFVPICYVPFTLLTALGALFLITGAICIATSAPRSQLKNNFLSRTAVCMSLNCSCWILSVIYVQVAINVITKSFLTEHTSSNSTTNNASVLYEWECPYTANSRDQLVLWIVGGVAFGVVLCYLPLSIATFAAFWRSSADFKLKPSVAELPTIALRRNMAITSDSNLNEVLQKAYESVIIDASEQSLEPALTAGATDIDQPSTDKSDPSQQQQQQGNSSSGSSQPQANSLPSQTQQRVTEDIYAVPQKPAVRKAASLSAAGSAAYTVTGDGQQQPVMQAVDNMKALRCMDGLRTTSCSCLVDSLASLKPIAVAKLGYLPDEMLVVYLDSTGEEVATEADFCRIPNHSTLVICSRNRGHVWAPTHPRDVGAAFDNKSAAARVASQTQAMQRPGSSAGGRQQTADNRGSRNITSDTDPISQHPHPPTSSLPLPPYRPAAKLTNGGTSYAYPSYRDKPVINQTSPFSQALVNAGFENEDNAVEFVI